MKTLKSLFSGMLMQMIVAVFVAMMLALALSFFILEDAHRTAITDVNRRVQFEQVESLVWLLENNPAKDRPVILAAANNKSVFADVSPTPIIPLDYKMTEWDEFSYHRLLSTLGKNFTDRVIVRRQFKQKPVRPEKNHRNHRDDFEREFGKHTPDRLKEYKTCGPTKHGPAQRFKLLGIEIAIQLNDGNWLNLAVQNLPPPPLLAKQTFIFLALSLVLVLLVLALLLSRIIKPLRALTTASVKLGRGESVAAVNEQGPEDLRKTIRAFNQMNERLQRYVSDRTRMLAAISHDLRTPITSLLLRVEMMPPSTDTQRLKDSLEEMQSMVEATLSFARQLSDNEETSAVDIDALLISICDDLQELGQPVHYDEYGEHIIRCRPINMKRALRNLIENGVKYGQKTNIHLTSSNYGVTIFIKDSGPGIAEDQQEKVFEPFYRIEASRNKETGGIGLGMAIARGIVRQHGGDITLSNEDDGLLVTVFIPTV